MMKRIIDHSTFILGKVIPFSREFPRAAHDMRVVRGFSRGL